MIASPEPSAALETLEAPSQSLLPPTPKPGHKRNGMIAKLPKNSRDKVNLWLDDGHTYPEIIELLGDQGKELNPDHVSQWFKGGYQDYLRQQDWRAELR